MPLSGERLIQFNHNETMQTIPKIILLARIETEKHFIGWTGRYNDTPQFEERPRPVALVFSRDLSERARAEEFARREGYSVLTMPDTDDVLQKARQAILTA